MGQPGVANFYKDLAFADLSRLRLERYFYPNIARDGRFVGLERSNGSVYIQRHCHVDCIVASKNGGSVAFEEKIVRWPGKKYTAMVIETHSNYERTLEEKIGDGWIKTSVADFLLYAFEQADRRLLTWVFDLPKLREWFINSDHEKYPLSLTDNGYYSTACRVVPLSDIPADCVVIQDKLI